MTISAADLRQLLPDYLSRQRWFSGSEVTDADVGALDIEVLEAGPPTLLRVLANVSNDRYLLLLGLRPVAERHALQGHDASMLGAVTPVGEADESEAAKVVVYDAVIDSELTCTLLRIVVPGREPASLVRPVGAEQSNTSVVFDDEVILKIFRRLRPGANPDVEVTQALAAAGFDCVAEPLGVWREDDHDLAIAQRFLAGGSEGWALALTSLRDLLGSPMGPDGFITPAEAGGDFAAEAERLGEMTARLHVAMTKAFPTVPGEAARWVGLMRDQLERVATGTDEWVPAARAAFDRVLALDEVGVAARVHGDYHLGQVMRTDTGWFVLDFEGEPARPIEERRKHSSPLKDVAGMLRSFHYASATAVRDRVDDGDDSLAAVGRAWEEHNRTAFLEGYLSVKGVADLLPSRESDILALLAAYEVDKAIYELAYERAHRPAWEDIPLAALSRLAV